MKYVATKDLTAGMITAETVRSKTGQLLIQPGVALTNQQIRHLEFYGISQIAIKYDDVIPAVTIPVTPDVIHYQQSVRDSIEFKHFRKVFNEKTAFFKKLMNDVIVRNEPIVQQALLSDTIDLFNRISSTVNIFDMLHCIRRIDDSTYAHCINVGIICRMMGQWLNYSQEDIDVLTLAGLLHDIGKCQIPKHIMSKPGTLTTEEYGIVKKHCIDGYNILKNHPLDSRIKRAALMHHEKCDGSGYPVGLMRDDIDDFAIIVSIADVYDAMTTNRCYRAALCPFEVIATFEREGFNKYKPQYVLAFLSHVVDTYMNNRILLNNGCYGKIVLKNNYNLARPTIYSDDNRFIDLSQHPDLFIQAIV